MNGAERRGAFPETADALNKAAPTIAFGRPYTPDFVGWMDDFSTTGGYDALGGFSRAWINLSELLFGAGPKLNQSTAARARTSSPPGRQQRLLGDEAAALDCDPNQRSVGRERRIAVVALVLARCGAALFVGAKTAKTAGARPTTCSSTTRSG